MSVADIIKAAIERAIQVNSKHADEVDAAQKEFASNLGKPWKFKAESLREALSPPEESNDNRS